MFALRDLIKLIKIEQVAGKACRATLSWNVAVVFVQALEKELGLRSVGVWASFPTTSQYLIDPGRS